MIENLLLDEGVFGKTLHNQEERRRGISLYESKESLFRFFSFLARANLGYGKHRAL
jgi:hypothetical protein